MSYILNKTKLYIIKIIKIIIKIEKFLKNFMNFIKLKYYFRI